MRGLLLKDEKGVSIMIGYVLLIVIAISISTLVYAYLKFYVPSNRAECPDDVSISINSVSCESGKVNLILENRGLFSIDGAYVKIGQPDRVFRDTLCMNENLDDSNCDINFGLVQTKGLPPGETFSKVFDYDHSRYSGTYGDGTGEREIEIQPVVISKKNEWLVCKNAIITQTIECT